MCNAHFISCFANSCNLIKKFKTIFEYIRKKFRFVHTNTFCEYRKNYAHRLACILFIDKIDKIRTEFPLLEVDLPPFSFVDMDSIMPVCTASLDPFDIVTVEELTKRLLVSLTPFQLNFCFLILLQSSLLYCTL